MKKLISKDTLKKEGRCPLDYEKVTYIGDGLYRCKWCGARLERHHLTAGRNSLERVNNNKPYFT